jgi:hypothetical protein
VPDSINSARVMSTLSGVESSSSPEGWFAANRLLTGSFMPWENRDFISADDSNEPNDADSSCRRKPYCLTVSRGD